MLKEQYQVNSIKMSRKIWERCVNDVLLSILSKGVHLDTEHPRYLCTIHIDKSLPYEPKYDVKNIYTLINKYVEEFVKIYDHGIGRLVQYGFIAGTGVDQYELYGDPDGEEDEILYKDCSKCLSELNAVIPIVVQLEENFYFVANIIEHYVAKAYCYPLLERYFDVNTVWMILDNLGKFE